MTEPMYEDGTLSPEELELLAAYIDDRLTETDRAAVEQLLARSARARAVLATASAIDDESQSAPEAGHAPPPRRIGRWFALTPLAAAAVLAFILLGDGQRTVADELVARVTGAAHTPTAFDGWIRTRGSSDPRESARLAARWFDVRVLAATGQDEAARAELDRLTDEVGNRPGGEELRSRLETLSTEQAWSDEAVRRTEAALRTQGPTSYEAGLRLAALRHAAMAGDSALAAELAGGLTESADASDLGLAGSVRDGLAAFGAGDPVPLDEVRRLAELALRSLGP